MFFLVSVAHADPLADYQVAVRTATAAVEARAIPKIAVCKRPTTPLVLTIDLAMGTIETAALTSSGGVRTPTPCVEAAVLAALTPRPAVGAQAIVVLDASGRLDGDVALLGTLPSEDIENGVRPGVKAVAACYAAGLAQKPGLAGELVVSFSVLPDGRVLEPKIKRSSIESAETTDCVLAQVSGMRFAPPSTGAIARVAYPFTFKPPE